MEAKLSEAVFDVVSYFSSHFPGFSNEWSELNPVAKDHFSQGLQQQLFQFFIGCSKLVQEPLSPPSKKRRLNEVDGLQALTPASFSSPIKLYPADEGPEKKKEEEREEAPMQIEEGSMELQGNKSADSGIAAPILLLTQVPVALWKIIFKFLEADKNSVFAIRLSCHYFHDIVASFFTQYVPLCQLEFFVFKYKELGWSISQHLQIFSAHQRESTRALRHLPNTTARLKLIECTSEEDGEQNRKAHPVFTKEIFQYFPSQLKELDLSEVEEHVNDEYFPYICPSLEKITLPYWNNDITETGIQQIFHLFPNLHISFHAKGKGSRSLLYWACSRGKLDFVQFVLEKYPKELQNIDQLNSHLGNTALFIAAQEGHTDVCELLLRSGANINKTRDVDSGTPLCIASQQGQKEVIQLLLKYGADVNKALSNGGSTPLFLASQKGHRDIVELLLKFGANPNKVRFEDGSHPLYIACLNERKEIVELLLKYNANPNLARTDSGSTPLIAAVLHNNLGLISLLLKFGADPSLRDKPQGRTALDIAIEEGYTESAELLQSVAKPTPVPPPDTSSETANQENN